MKSRAGIPAIYHQGCTANKSDVLQPIYCHPYCDWAMIAKSHGEFCSGDCCPDTAPDAGLAPHTSALSGCLQMLRGAKCRRHDNAHLQRKHNCHHQGCWRTTNHPPSPQTCGQRAVLQCPAAGPPVSVGPPTRCMVQTQKKSLDNVWSSNASCCHIIHVLLAAPGTGAHTGCASHQQACLMAGCRRSLHRHSSRPSHRKEG